MSKETSLHGVHKGLGALFTDFAGWSMPVRYASELAEHKAVREAAGLFDLSHMAEIHVTGKQAADVLDFALVGNLTGVKPGRARYTMICNESGGVLDDLVVYRLADEHYLVVANAGNAQVVADALAERVAGFDAVVDDRSETTALIAVQGPKAVEILGAVTDADLDALKYYASVPASVKGHDVLLARTGYTGEDGFELFVDADEAPALWRLLLEAGEPPRPGPGRAGLPRHAAPRSRDAVVRQRTHRRAEPVRGGARPGRQVREAGRLRRPRGPGGAVQAGRPAACGSACRGAGRRAPRHGYAVLAEGTEIGEVTSGALSPTLGYPIAMAYVDRAYAEPGTELSVDIRGRIEPVEVVALPFYSRA